LIYYFISLLSPQCTFYLCTMPKITKIALLASGSGSNAEAVCRYFQGHPSIKISFLLFNRKSAKAAERVSSLGISSHFFGKNDWETGEKPLQFLKGHKIDWIILAGFLLKIPKSFTETFPNKMINLHPSLLPKFGGKGMYGRHVHEAVIEAKESEAGISIHLVNEKFDDGRVLFQASIPVSSNETPETLAQRINEIELIHFPRGIEKTITHGI
jgi:phosphoribosylglycinamide formyltransferase-1